ncbi:Type-1 restriction enzyme R protein [Candidatus Izimaplasma bacterium HR1]|jgi:type I restriction enzyme R subunit|uniref:type I restriction endonuclease subunit R, EcoR124 family n=1 Tax=Candidatus Izimoplasma sp. HR1 TaxID=1541959 RepID=UPI0004F70F69|nr:Type-1 restriction enzyme R protein [Candidatus Izimaplasma bacterium HR1]
MAFDNELAFEKELITLLSHHGWEKEIIKNPTEEDLLKNWAGILFDNNRELDRLNNQPLTDSELQQILEQINTLRTPVKLNGFINGKTVSIKRDNPNDPIHLGKEISLKIYDRMEIAAGQSRYQIVSQPRFKTSGVLNDRRGDIMLLINGMPVIHIELKKSGIPVSQAAYQIENYSRAGVFRGLFSLVQIFVAMNPEDAIYFANPGENNKFNSDYYFHWADFNNEHINDWKIVTSTLLSIPMAHQLIGFYTVADSNDGLLKALRSYQYYAVRSISNKVAKTDWSAQNNLGGYIWHTTGSGKTMTSFKAAQLISSSKDADKVIFLVDRIELGTQSLKAYRNFANENEDVQATENSKVLATKLKSTNPKDTLIVTSIQKMSNISEDEEGLRTKDIELMKSKRVVFIVDEAHRSTFGDMLYTIKNTFSQAIFFGFTGTPIHEENEHKDSTTADVFGNELHRYSIADGIRDKNVLGFDPYKVSTFKDKDLRQAVALEKAKSKDVSEAISDPIKSIKYYEYMNNVPMVGSYNDSGKYIKGIEDYIPMVQYDNNEHRSKVVNDIVDNWVTLSRNYKFHSILATSSINEAIIYYRLFKVLDLDLKVVGLFDPSIDNVGGAAFKEDGLVELLEDYNERYSQSFTIGNWGKYKKDIASRLAHKTPYISIEKTPDKQVDLLIVVDQMLTGYDSKWINTLYVDKLMKYEHIVQAFSRTNRLFGPDKPFGTVKYYRKPHTMERNIRTSIKLYSGDKPLGLFVPKLKDNLDKMNSVYTQIESLFNSNGDFDFSKLPDDPASKAKFSKLFRQLNESLEAAKIQRFKWEDVKVANEISKDDLIIKFDETNYLTLALRYKELSGSTNGSGSGDTPYEIEGYLTEIPTGLIDTNYMNSNFNKYLKALDTGNEKDVKNTLDELHSSFSSLSQEEQKYAYIFLHDIERGDVKVIEGKNLREYITEYQVKAKNDQISLCASIFGLDEVKLRFFMTNRITMESINEYGRFDDLKNTIDFKLTRSYFENLESKKLSPPRIHMKLDEFLRKFIIEGGFEIKDVEGQP